MKFGLNEREIKLYKSLNTPQKIQEYLNRLPINFELKGDTCHSPRSLIRHKTAHCMEGALFAASVLWFHGYKPLLLDLVAYRSDYDHVVTLFRQGKHWGAISKSNHSVLRWRDPVYKSVRELAMSYFHEYYLPDGTKSMQSFSRPFNLTRFGKDWITSEDSVVDIAHALDDSPHIRIIAPEMKNFLRRADGIETKAGELEEWDKRGKIKI